jgi:HSP20 family molecular chaperone IbpA
MATDEIRFLQVLFLSSVEAHEHVWRPRADVHRLTGGWLVKVELAGVCPDDVRIVARGDRLCIQGTRRDVEFHECLDCQCLEIEYSRFERTLELPGLSESAQIGVSYRDGMLLIRIRTEESR